MNYLYKYRPNFYLYLFIFIAISLLKSYYCQDIGSCGDEFNVSSSSADIVQFIFISPNTASLSVNVLETVAVSSTLYYISWKSSTQMSINNQTDTNTALEYVLISYGDFNLLVEVKKSMAGIVDYDHVNRQTSLELVLYFEFSNNPYSPCEIDIRHNLLDANTQEPHFNFKNYHVDVREDLPVGSNIPNLQPMAYDFDATFPNNVFRIDISPECLLQPSHPYYNCSEGGAVPVSFSLTESLDFDAVGSPIQYDCTVTLMDFGTPPKMSTSTIFINVLPYPDEGILFTSVFYSGYLSESLAGSEVDIDPAIEATGLDVPSSSIFYKLTSVDSIIGGEKYFSINSTGDVIVIQDLDNDFLSWDQVNFFLHACDTANQCTKSLLTIELPPQSTSGTKSLEFEKKTYSAQIESPFKNSSVLMIYAMHSNDHDAIRYSFVDDGSSGLHFFDINEISGVITTALSITPAGNYLLPASATDGDTIDKTVVNIEVLTRQSYTVVVNESYVSVSIPEKVKADSVYTINGERAVIYCILGIFPFHYIGYFDIDQQTGTIFMTKEINFDDSYYGSKIIIKAAAYSEPTACIPSTNINNPHVNEVVIELEIMDVNDNAPYFIDPTGRVIVEIIYAYPLEPTLRRAVGPIAKVEARDPDISSTTLTYTLESYDETSSLDNFAIDYYSGEIFLTNENEMNATKFYVLASDSVFTNYLLVRIEILTLEYISSISFNYVNESQVEDKIREISNQAYIPIYILYNNLLSWGTYWKVDAQVYATNGTNLLDFIQLKNALLESNVNVEMEPFYSEDIYNEKSYRTATIVLGCVSGFLFLVLVVIVIFNVWCRVH